MVVAAEPARASLQDGGDASDSRHAGRFFVAVVGVEGAYAAPALILDVAHLRAVTALAHQLVVADCGDCALHVVMRSLLFPLLELFFVEPIPDVNARRQKSDVLVRRERAWEDTAGACQEGVRDAWKHLLRLGDRHADALLGLAEPSPAG